MKQVTNLQKIETVVNQKNKIFDNETVKKLQKSERDIENGKTRKAIEVIKEFRLKYGF